MSFINRAWGLIEYGGYHLALAKMPSMYEDSSLTAIAFGIAGGLAQPVSFSPSGNDTTERIALTAGGTPEQLTAHAALEVTVQALTGNTTYVYVGTTATPAADGVELVQGSSFTFSLTADTDEIWWVSATIADEVTITYRS